MFGNRGSIGPFPVVPGPRAQRADMVLNLGVRPLMAGIGQGLGNLGQGLAQRSQNQFAAQQQQAQQKFQTGEREGGQQFTAGQNTQDRNFRAGEAGKDRTFQAGQAATDRGFRLTSQLMGQQHQTGERLGGQGFAAQQAKGEQAFRTGERQAGEKHDVTMAGVASKNAQKLERLRAELNQLPPEESMALFDEVMANGGTYSRDSVTVPPKGRGDAAGSGGGGPRATYDSLPVNIKNILDNAVLAAPEGRSDTVREAAANAFLAHVQKYPDVKPEAVASAVVGVMRLGLDATAEQQINAAKDTLSASGIRPELAAIVAPSIAGMVARGAGSASVVLQLGTGAESQATNSPAYRAEAEKRRKANAAGGGDAAGASVPPAQKRLRAIQRVQAEGDASDQPVLDRLLRTDPNALTPSDLMLIESILAE